MEAIREALYVTLAEQHPMTVRQVFYALTTQGVIAKTETEYKGTVVRLLGEMRRTADLPYEWLADATRWMRKPRTYSSADAALRRTAETYRRALWDHSDTAVEVWLEKEALAGVLVEVTNKWDIPLMVTRGYPSMSFLYSAAMSIQEDRRTQIYYFGDRDPSGIDIDRAIRHGIGESLQSTIPVDNREPTPELEFDYFADFERVAVTDDQILEWDLPTRPTKPSDSRSKRFEGRSVELDAIPVDRLRQLARGCRERHVDHHQLDALRVVEAEERKVLLRLADALDDRSEIEP